MEGKSLKYTECGTVNGSFGTCEYLGGGDVLRKSKIYQYQMDEEDKKRTGSFYTDNSIIRYMLKGVLEDIDLVQNPYIKILDPACGCGYFLLAAYDMLTEMYNAKLPEIKKMHPGLELNEESIHEHILKHNLFGADIDEYAVKLSIEGLMMKKKDSKVIPNIICCDSVTCLNDKCGMLNQGFNIIIGNPPYIGHKKLSGDYRRVLNEIYGDIFRDKADISFCFIKCSIDRLVDNGRLCFITSRYFIESPSGKAIRGYMAEKCLIESIIDFYGVRIMKGISVDPVIITLKKRGKPVDNIVKVARAKSSLKNVEGDDIFKGIDSERNCHFRFFTVKQHDLKSEGWMLLDDAEMSIIERIENRLQIRLSDICMSFQGIITGCDRAFILDDSEVEKFGIERDIIRPWIKNSSIDRFKVKRGNKYIIYSDFIDRPEGYKNAISFIGRYRDRLEKRRECIKGIRNWYQLQWGRKSSNFESRKIIFPYKSSCSRFALDKGSYCSADIYGMLIKEGICSVSYEFLLGLLNSSLYEFYFKSFAKKLGDNLYDYYPNTVMRLMVPSKDDEFISWRVKKIMEGCDKNTAVKIMNEIDMRLYDMFDIKSCEIDIIERGNNHDICGDIGLQL